VCSDPVSVQHEANCTFEDGLCNSFVQDFSRTVPWKPVPGDRKTIDIPAALLPTFDHTTMSRRHRIYSPRSNGQRLRSQAVAVIDLGPCGPKKLSYRLQKYDHIILSVNHGA